MSTPLEVIQEGEGVFWKRLVDTYSIKNEDRPTLDTSSSLFGIKGMIDDVYQSQTLALLQALHDELEEKRGMKSGDEKAQYFWHGHSQAIQDQQDNLQALMDKIQV